MTRTARTLARTLAFAVLALALAACGGAAASPTPAPSVDPDAVKISANGLKFDKTTLTAPADEQFQIAFENKEGAPHNVAIYKDPNFSQQVFAEAPFAGPRLVTYSVPALSAGSYVFVCDVHRDMKGTLTVQ